MSRVLILGCGPSGLMAAAAAEEAGCDVTIASKKRKSEMFGAQYLHAPIPGYSPDMSFDVTYELHGTADEYRKKVYGDTRVRVSPEELAADHEGWDIRTTYDNLWNHFQEDIEPVEFRNYLELEGFLGSVFATGSFNHFVSTIPAPLLCDNPAHAFPSQKVWAIGDAPERGIFCPISAPLNHVMCSGLPDNSWYRCANILGYKTAEWPEKKKPPYEGASLVNKPLGTNCDCLKMVHRLGRYGKWEKGVLSHQSYYETLSGLSNGGFDAEVPTEKV